MVDEPDAVRVLDVVTTWLIVDVKEPVRVAVVVPVAVPAGDGVWVADLDCAWEGDRVNDVVAVWERVRVPLGVGACDAVTVGLCVPDALGLEDELRLPEAEGEAVLDCDCDCVGATGQREMPRYTLFAAALRRRLAVKPDSKLDGETGIL